MNYDTKKMGESELQVVLGLVERVFNEFEKPDYSDEGFKFANFESISKGLKNNLEIYVAKVGEKIVGMICVRDKSHIALLFVDKDYHHQGIAKNLVEHIKVLNKNKVLTVNSSPYAIKFYQKIGFVAESEMQEIDGIKFVPMKMEVTKTFTKE